MRLQPARLIANGFGVGLVPVAAGTAASAVATLVGAGLMLVSPGLLAAAAVLATIGGIWAIRHVRIEGDPGWVVIDEYAGQFITLLGLAQVTPRGLLLAFLLFRLLDITKLGPIGWADRQHGPFGIIGDDVIAGLIAAALLVALQAIWPSLLA
ncbi:MAG: phosphatidylglycerophosphatase A [Rhodospirillales bacterium]|nr:phosphatidylglycerophosphatase A [Rhodospirillales bacterium]